MKGFPKFKSPLVIRPKPKQFVYLLLTLIGYLALQGWRVFRAVTSLDVLTIVTSVLLMAVAVWHVWRVRRYAEADVTEMLPSIIVLGGTIMLTKLIGFLCSLSAFSVPSLLFHSLYAASASLRVLAFSSAVMLSLYAYSSVIILQLVLRNAGVSI